MSKMDRDAASTTGRIEYALGLPKAQSLLDERRLFSTNIIRPQPEIVGKCLVPVAHVFRPTHYSNSRPVHASPPPPTSISSSSSEQSGTPSVFMMITIPAPPRPCNQGESSRGRPGLLEPSLVPAGSEAGGERLQRWGRSVRDAGSEYGWSSREGQPSAELAA